MELQHLNLLSCAHRLSIEHLFVEASNHVSSDHRRRLADHLRSVRVDRCLHNAVFILNYQHELSDAGQVCSDELHTLDFVTAESPVVMPLLLVVLQWQAALLRHRLDVKLAAEQEQRLLEGLGILLERRTIVAEPGVTLEAH